MVDAISTQSSLRHLGVAVQDDVALFTPPVGGARTIGAGHPGRGTPHQIGSLMVVGVYFACKLRGRLGLRAICNTRLRKHPEVRASS